jgi:hypothetical protein
MMVFMGWSALPQSTPIQRSFFFLAHSANWLDLYAILDVLGGVYVVVPRRVGQVHHHSGMHQVVQRQRGDVAARGVEVDLAVQMGAHVVGVGQQLAVGPVGSQPLEVLHLQRFVGGPGRSADAQGDGKLDG